MDGEDTRSSLDPGDLLEAAPDAIVIVDAGGTVLVVNTQAERLFGYSRAELVGGGIEQLVPEGRRGAHAAQREKFAASPATRPMGIGLDLNGRRRDGSEFPVEISLSPLETDGGTVFMSAIRDASERKRTEAELREREEKLAEAQAIARLGSWEWDIATGEVSWSDELYRVYGIEPRSADIDYAAWLGFMHPDDREHADECVRRTFETREPFDFTHRILDAHGEIRTLHCRGRVMVDDGGAPVRMSGTGQDVTKEHEAKTELERHRNHLEELVGERTRALSAANRELEAFSYSVSHDLRAPLRALDGFGRALAEDHAEALDEEGLRHLGRIRAASRRMAELIDGLLGLSRINRGELRRQLVDLSALARETGERLQAAEPERGVELVVADGLTTPGDPMLLAILVENLLSNAWKFTRGRSAARIEVGVEMHEANQVFFVRDDGVGFDMAYVDKLFGAFQRLHGQADFEGNGIGLATVLRIVRRHDGLIWAEAEPGRGASFYFTLSLTQAGIPEEVEAA